MPRSRSSSMLSSTCSRISRASSPPQAWISRSARVDLPWSICAMIAKLRIWLSGVIAAEHKDAAARDQRKAARRSQNGEREAQRRCSGDQPIVVARQLDGLALLTEECHCREVQSVQRAERKRPWL